MSCLLRILANASGSIEPAGGGCEVSTGTPSFRASAVGMAACMSLGLVGIATNGKLLQPDATTYQVALLDYDSDNRALQEATWDPLRLNSGLSTSRTPFKR